MPELKAGDSFPEGVSFTYVPYTPEQADIIACGIGIKYDASKGKFPSHSARYSQRSHQARRTQVN